MEAEARLNVKIKYVNKAKMWCTTYFILDKQGKMVQKQEWTDNKPEGEQQ